MFLRRKRRRRTRAATPGAVILKQVLIGFFVIAVLALIGVGIWYGTRVSGLTISSVAVSGGETVAHEEIRAIAERELSGSYFKLVPHRFAWFYPEEAIEAAIDAHERVKEVDVKRPSGTELSVWFAEYHPAMLWCPSITDTRCIFIDAEGYAFEMAPALSGNAFLRYSDTARAPALAEHVFDRMKVELLLALRSALSERYGFVLTHVEQTAPEELTYHIAEGGALKVSERMPIEETLANLETILASEEFAHLANGTFEYIDLRYGDRVFVNQVGEADDAPNENAASESEIAE